MSDVYLDHLEHYGVKGMKWGIRKERTTAGDKESTGKESTFSWKNPKVKAAATAVVGVTAIVAAAYIGSKSSVNVSSILPSDLSAGKEAVAKIFEKQKDIIYVSKPYRGSGKRTTLGFVNQGQTKDFFSIFDEAGLNDDHAPGYFSKLSNGSVATVLSDMFGRVDDAGRAIPHMVLFPPEQAVGLNSVQDVIDKFGPRLESEYQKFIENRDS